LKLKATRVFIPNGISIGSAAFVQLTVQCPYTLQGPPFSHKKLPLSLTRLGSLSNTWFPRTTRVTTPNSTSIGSAGFTGLMNLTNRHKHTQTHHTAPYGD